jgi:PTH2 family peptidyl-tRNA hydrolase
MSGKDFKQVIVVRKDLKLSRGKMSAQVAHASLEAFMKAKNYDSVLAEMWLRHGGKKVVVYVKDQDELIDLYNKARGLPKALITDAGHTHLKPGTTTCIGIGPAETEKIERITSHLKLVN